MNKKIFIPAILSILFIFVLIFSFFSLSPKKSKDQTQIQTSQIILFVGDGCPHCAIVEDYIQKNKIADKISFVQKEVYHNQDNAKELEDKAKACGLSTDSIGIPFLWDGEKCVIGDQDVINFFKSKTNQQ